MNNTRILHVAGCLAVLALVPAHAADTIGIAFSPATQKSYGNTVVWKVPAPSGANMNLKVPPGVLKQTTAVTLGWKGFEATDQVWPTAPPGPGSVQLNASGQAAVPIVFPKGSHKQWMITACVKWQPSGYDHKIDDCTYAYLEGEDKLAQDAEKLIKIVSPAHPGPPHNWKKIPVEGNQLGVSVHDDLLAKSADKTVRLKYYKKHTTTGGSNNWPGSTDKLAPKTISLAGAASQGGWSMKSVPFQTDPDGGEWLTVQACLTLEYSGEVCGATYAYKLTESKSAKMSDQPKDYKVDSSQPLPPMSPPSSGGGTDKGNLMAPPPMLGAPAAGLPASPAPASRTPPPAPAMAPIMAPSPARDGRTAAVASVPGCAAIAGAPDRFVCATRETYAGCERLRVAGTSGVRACVAGEEGRRR